MAASLLSWGCRQTIIPEGQDKLYSGLIPQNIQGIARVYIDTPAGQAISSKRQWVELSTIRIEADVEGKVLEIYKADSLKIKGRGNTTWEYYPKKPYSFKLKHKADFVGSGKTSRWVLLANWMDRTHLRNDVAFEAARRTSMEWAPSGTFVKLILNGEDEGLYWLGERIHVEGSNFLADYLYSYDDSDTSEYDFYTKYGRWSRGSKDGEIPVELKFPDKDDYDEAAYSALLKTAEAKLHTVEDAIYTPDGWRSVIDLNSFCDWYLIQELCFNTEPIHPKSCFFYLRDNILYAGPVWDFDWGTFTWDDSNRYLNLNLKQTLYYHQLLPQPAFKSRLKERWRTLKPQFESLTKYIDQQAAVIRRYDDFDQWPCYPNPLSEDHSGLVNYDEKLSFDEAVELMKTNLLKRISAMDTDIRSL